MERILITGASSGIIKKVIEKLNDTYYIYTAVHTSSEEKRLKEIYKTKENINVFKLDIENDSDIEKINNLDIDILVLNAAYGFSSPLYNSPISKIKKTYNTNIIGNIKLIQKILPTMIKKNKGKIIFISSIAGIMPIEFLSIYSSSKAAIITLALSLNKELKLMNKNIKVKIIEPGIYKTGFNEYMHLTNNLEGYASIQKKKIKLKEFFLFNLLGKDNLNDIAKTIIKAINSNSNRIVYSKPKSEKLLAKLYQLFKY